MAHRTVQTHIYSKRIHMCMRVDHKVDLPDAMGRAAAAVLMSLPFSWLHPSVGTAIALPLSLSLTLISCYKVRLLTMIALYTLASYSQ